MRLLLYSLLLGVGFALVSAPAALATTLTLGLNVEFSGATPPDSPTTPWATATFDDSFGGPNTVRLTMSTDNLIDDEFLSQFYLNFDPALDPTLLSITAVDNSASVPTGVSTGVDAFMSDGDGNYDILFDFPPPPGDAAAKFTAGESVIYDLTYISPITAASFNFFSEEGGGNGTYLAAAQIQGIGPGALESGWIGVVPEPSTALLLGMGLGALSIGRRARR